jgi:hypothetical protein
VEGYAVTFFERGREKKPANMLQNIHIIKGC